MMINDKSSFFERKAPNMISGVVCCDIWEEHVNNFNHFNLKLSYHRVRDINMNQAVWFIFTKIAYNVFTFQYITHVHFYKIKKNTSMPI